MEEKTLFRDTEELLEEVYTVMKNTGKENIIKKLSGKELQACYSVLDLCEAVYEFGLEK